MVLADRELHKVTFGMEIKRKNMMERIHAQENNIPLLKHIVHHIHNTVMQEKEKIQARHKQKICKWSQRQDKPVCKVDGTVKLIGNIEKPPEYVIETLKFGPRNPIMTEFDQKALLAEMDIFLEYCETKSVENTAINDLNMHTHAYCKQASQMRPPRNLKMTYEYLKENRLKAIPFDKGLVVCLMKEEDYFARLDKITDLNQFQIQLQGRKNEKNPAIKKEDRICKELMTLQKKGHITEDLYKN